MTLLVMDIGKLKSMLKRPDFSLGKVEGGAAIAVQLTNDAREERIVGIENDVVEINLPVSPSEAAANKVLIRFLAKRLGVKATAIEVVAGQSGPRKLVSIVGMAPAELSRILKL